MASKYEWDRNIWTGNSIARVTESIRLIRVGDAEGFLYSAEDWGDHSTGYPVKGPWESTPTKAIRELKKEALSVVVVP
jgi:hypothetical protein